MTLATRSYIGRKVLVPILGREIPVIADEYVDREFGTGALKITPGHDPNDYEIGQSTTCPSSPCWTETAHVNENGGPYQGHGPLRLPQEAVGRHGRRPGLVIKEEPYTLNVPRSQRGGEIVEPMVSTQWFVKHQTAGGAALAAVQRRAHQHRARALYQGVFQLAGKHPGLVHQPPVVVGPPHPGVVLRGLRQMTVHPQDPAACADCGSHQLHQDPDVLDTWFSSGLWPFSTLGWPEQTPDLAYFYPTSVHGDRLRHPVLLGGAHDHVWPGVHRQSRLSTPSTCTAWSATSTGKR